MPTLTWGTKEEFIVPQAGYTTGKAKNAAITKATKGNVSLAVPFIQEGSL